MMKDDEKERSAELLIKIASLVDNEEAVIALTALYGNIFLALKQLPLDIALEEIDMLGDACRISLEEAGM